MGSRRFGALFTAEMPVPDGHIRPVEIGAGGARRGAALLAGLLVLACAAEARGADRTQESRQFAALYPQDGRRDLTGADFERYRGAGILWCRGSDGVPQKAAAAWLIADPSTVLLNAHNFRDRRLAVTRPVADCYFQIGGRNYGFDPDSLVLGTAPGADSLHITDDWAILRLDRPADAVPQPLPEPPDLPVGDTALPVTLVSPAGHGNYRGPNSLERCTIRRIDPPGADAIRRARHDCNDGYGGSGSGLFDEAGRLVALQSASLAMNSRSRFDIEFHYGSALLVEGGLLSALRRLVRERPHDPG